MIIRQIEVENFKSFDKLVLNMNNFTVLVGENASGKSNFVNIFSFLNNIINYGLDNAISMQGGKDYINNLNIGASKNVTISILAEADINEDGNRMFFPTKNKVYQLKIKDILYSFSIKFFKDSNDYEVTKEDMYINGELYNLKLKQAHEIEEKYDDIKISLNRRDNVIKPLNIVCLKKIIIDKEYFSIYSRGGKHEVNISKKMLFIESNIYFPYFFRLFVNLLKNISIYNIDPKLPKRSTIFTGKNELEFDGNNLSLVLKKILEDEKSKNDFRSLIHDLLPFVEDISIERYSDKSVIANLTEVYTQNKKYIPASLLSDGTINVIALIIILYFENKPFVIIEEPERGMHPYLISKVVNMMYEVSSKKQMIITTHNPKLVKHTNIENLYCIKRNNKGYSIIKEASKMENLNSFLTNNIGIDHLFVKKILGGIE